MASDQFPWPISGDRVSLQLLRSLPPESARYLAALIKRRNLKYGGASFAKKQARQVLKGYRKATSKAGTPTQQTKFPDHPHSSALLDAFVPDRSKIWRQRARRKGGLTTINLQKFSFIDQPVETLKKLQQLAVAECKAMKVRVNFMDNSVHDVGPYLVFGLMQRHFAPVLRGGRITATVQQAIEAVGLKHLLGMDFVNATQHVKDVWPFQLAQRTGELESPNLPDSPSKQEKVAANFASAVSHWLGQLHPPRELSEEGRGKVMNLIGEALNNAERHSAKTGDPGDWWIAGLMSPERFEQDGDQPEHAEYVCRAAIVSLGATIPETISASANPDVAADVVAYCKRHKGLCAEATLAMVMALQDGSTCRPEEEIGGVGIMDMAEMAYSLSAHTGNARSEMAIISGDSYTIFRAPYRFGTRSAEKEPRLQWFNAQNSYDLPPDPTHIMSLPVHIPGTVISLRFGIGPNMLVETED
jgi:hypothetical protein